MRGEVWPDEGVEVVWGRCGGGGDGEGEIRSGRGETDYEMQCRAGHGCGRGGLHTCSVFTIADRFIRKCYLEASAVVLT